MAKPKYVKLAVNLGVGSRKSQLNIPIEIEEDAVDTNTCDNELGVLIALFSDAVVSLPTVGGNYTAADVKEAIKTYFSLVDAP